MIRNFHRFGVSLILTVGFFSLVSCGKKGVKESDIVATWGDTAMTVVQFKEWMNVRYRNEAQAMKQSYQDRIDVLEEYVVRDAKLLEARRLGFADREDVLKEYNSAVEQKATELLYNDKVRDRMFSEQTVRDFYERDGEEVRARHLLIEVPETAGRDTAQYWEKISDIYARAKKGEDFIKLIDQFSQDNSLDPKAHGDLGFFRWGKMVDEFQEAAWNLKTGELSNIVRTRYGYHIIQVIDRRPTNLEYNTSHILVKINRKDSPAETTLAFERAKEILAELKKSGVSFAEIARKYSEDEKSWVNGEIGWVPKGNMPAEYWDRVYSMKEGESAGPVRTYKGFHIIKLNAKRHARRSLDDKETRDGVLSALSRIYREDMEKVANAYMDSVKRVFQMEYNDEVIRMLLRKLGDKSTPQNMNLFSSLTPEEREMLVVKDKLGGLKVQALVDIYGDHRFPPQYRNEPAFIIEMAEPMVTPKYLAEFARAEGYYNRPEAIKDGIRAADNVLLPAIEKEMIFNKGNPDEEEQKRYYQANIPKFSQPETRSGLEIMVDDKTLANDLLGRIKNGEDISALARRYSMRARAKNVGGKLSNFAREEYGPLSQKAFTMKVGEIAGPIDLDGKTWSIFKLSEVAPGRTKSFEEAQKQIESEVRFNNQKDLREKWIADLKKAYDIKYYEPVIRSVWPIIEPLPKEAEKERKKWKTDREDLAKRKAMEDRIKLKLQPGSKQEFTTKEGKKVQVEIGQPRYVDKEGKDIDPSKAKVKLTPKGSFEGTDSRGVKIEGGGEKPTIRLKPKEKPPAQPSSK